MKEETKKRGVNPIDVLIIIVILAALAFGGYKFMKRGSSAAGGKPITYTVLCPGVEPAVYEAAKRCLPSQLMATGTLFDGYITEVTAAPHQALMLSNGLGQPVSVEKEGLLDLTFTIEAEIKNPITNEIGKQEIRIGKTHIVKSVDIEIEKGIILDVKRGE